MESAESVVLLQLGNFGMVNVIEVGIATAEDEMDFQLVGLMTGFQLLEMLPETAEWCNARTRTNHVDGHCHLLRQVKRRRTVKTPKPK